MIPENKLFWRFGGFLTYSYITIVRCSSSSSTKCGQTEITILTYTQHFLFIKYYIQNGGIFVQILALFPENCFVFLTASYFESLRLPTANSKRRSVKKLRYQFSHLARWKVCQECLIFWRLFLMLLFQWFCWTHFNSPMFCLRQKEREKGVIVFWTINSSCFLELSLTFLLVLKPGQTYLRKEFSISSVEFENVSWRWAKFRPFRKHPQDPFLKIYISDN